MLMIANWGVEAYKWMLAIRQVQLISFERAFRAVLSGIAFSISTPNSIGDYVGRALFMADGNRIKAISLTIVANLSQLIITFVMGSIAFILLKNRLFEARIITPHFAIAFLCCSILMSILLLLFYFRLSWVIKIIDKLPWVKKFSWAIEAIEYLSATLLLKFLSLSLIRFIIFSTQYILLFKLYHVDVNIVECWMGISVMFLVMAIIPTIALFTDMGLKNELSIRLIGLFSNNHLGISLASLSIWLINLIFPALLGSLFVLGLKNIIKSKKESAVHHIP